MSSWTGLTKKIEAITLFVEDLEVSKQFYRQVFELPIHFEDESSAVFRFGDTLINLLAIGAAPELITPASVADKSAGSRFEMTISVDSIDEVHADLTSKGVEILNGPIDRPWGPRTVSFSDPSGHIWELAGPASTSKS